MKRMCIFLFTILLGAGAISVHAEEPDWSNYAELLSKHVHPAIKNRVPLAAVDYQGIKRDTLFAEVVKELEAFNTNSLQNQQERLAFYINAYNIYAIKMVVDNLPVESIKDVGNFFSPVWKKDIGRINGKVVSLDMIEHDILRKMGEPRIHMAIVCASVSCPDLRDEPFIAKRLSEQLDDQAVRFLNNSAKGVQIKSNKLYVSKIFDWFEEDFKTYGGVKNFILNYRKDLQPTVQVKSYLDYDWQLNTK